MLLFYKLHVFLRITFVFQLMINKNIDSQSDVKLVFFLITAEEIQNTHFLVILIIVRHHSSVMGLFYYRYSLIITSLCFCKTKEKEPNRMCFLPSLPPFLVYRLCASVYKNH